MRSALSVINRHFMLLFHTSIAHLILKRLGGPTETLHWEFASILLVRRNHFAIQLKSTKLVGHTRVNRGQR